MTETVTIDIQHFELYEPLKFGDMESAISHCSSNHDTALLRYRLLVLCPDPGHMKYQTKLH